MPGARRPPRHCPHITEIRRARTRSAASSTALALIVATLVGSEAALTAATAQAPREEHASVVTAKSLAQAIGAHASVRQMITVSSSSWGSQYANLRAWRRTGPDSWKLVRGPVRAVVGYNGWVVAADRVQSTGTTPAGRFGIPYAFGRKPDPGAELQYRHVDGNDWWPYEPRDPATYNVYQRHKAKNTHWRSGKSEHLDSYTKQYGYALVVGFNLPKDISYSPARKQWVAAQRADTERGGGIFLHVRGDGFTAGCVAMSRKNMRWLLRWVKPRAHARVVMGPHDYIVRL
jgi:L,D-peptidoglycan transpeptidase YkuD (ErfK/YbiS/YcfS/YnhG family)